MVSRLNLNRGSRVLDPCMGSGHFLAGIYDHLASLHRAHGVSDEEIYREIVRNQRWQSRRCRLPHI